MIVSLVAATLLTAGPRVALPIVAPTFSPKMKVVAASPEAAQSLRISLRLRDPDGVDALIRAQRDPASPLYRHWLTPAEFGDRFGQSAADYQRLRAAFEAAGLSTKAFHNRSYLEAEGTVGQVEKLLGIELVDAFDGEHRFRSFEGTPRLPSSLSAMVLSVGGLDTRQRFSRRLTANGAATMGPQDLRRFYDIESLHAQGYAGQLSRVALVGSIPEVTSQPSIDDVRYFYSAVSDSSATPFIDTLPLGSSQPDEELDVNVEEEMDMEMPTVASPLLQTVTMVQAPLDTLFTSGFNEINENLPDTTAVSVSFGGCEPLVADGGLLGDTAATANAVAQGVTEGIAFFASAGDYGAGDCYYPFEGFGSPVATVDFPGSIPYLISVGGTMYTGPFDANGGVAAYGDETAWNEDAGGIGVGGGGGESTFYPQPWYQHAPGTNDGGGREEPDIALLASVVPGVAIVDTLPGAIDNDGNGTSDASPMAAGMLALVNDFIGGCRIGSPAPELYALGRAQYGGGGARVFNDITTGSNSVNGVVGYAAGPGYDEATGLGSLDVAALAAAWPPCRVAPPVGVDAGPSPDAGQLMFSDGGLGALWVGGFALDAGPRGPYGACATIACDAGICATFPEGPAQCAWPCTASGAESCSSGNLCATTDAGSVCTSGCPQGLSLCVVDCNPADALGCGDGYYCAPTGLGDGGGYCTSGCATAADCPSGQTCLDGSCAQACDAADAGSCPLGEYCSPLDGGVGTCQFGCVVQANCGPSDVCVTAQCMVACDPGGDTATCDPDSYCASFGDGGGACTFGCLTTADCSPGLLCLSGYCVQACDPVSTSSPCGLGFYCAGLGDGGGICNYGCATASDCGPGMICLSSVCTATCDPTGTSTCPDGESCDALDAGVAVCASGCISNAECGAGESCVTCTGTCVTAVDAPGGPGSACTSYLDCSSGSDCLLSDAGYPDGFCAVYCQSGCGCPSGSTCAPSGYWCAANCSVSLGGPCRSGYVCDPQDTTDVGLCEPPCTSDQDCGVLGDQGTCDLGLGGLCIPLGVTPPTLTGSSSGASSAGSSSGALSSGASGTSSGSSSSGSISHGSSGGSSGSHGGASATSSTGGGSSSSGSVASSHGTSETAAAATSGTSGGSSKAGKGGCGCQGVGASGPLWVLLGMPAWSGRRRRRAVRR